MLHRTAAQTLMRNAPDRLLGGRASVHRRRNQALLAGVSQGDIRNRSANPLIHGAETNGWPGLRSRGTIGAT
jgi:hypothetical protein